MLAGVARLAEIIADIGAALAPWPAQESTTTRLVAVLQKSPKADRSVLRGRCLDRTPFCHEARASRQELQKQKSFRDPSKAQRVVLNALAPGFFRFLRLFRHRVAG